MCTIDRLVGLTTMKKVLIISFAIIAVLVLIRFTTVKIGEKNRAQQLAMMNTKVVLVQFQVNDVIFSKYNKLTFGNVYE